MFSLRFNTTNPVNVEICVKSSISLLPRYNIFKFDKFDIFDKVDLSVKLFEDKSNESNPFNELIASRFSILFAPKYKNFKFVKVFNSVISSISFILQFKYSKSCIFDRTEIEFISLIDISNEFNFVRLSIVEISFILFPLIDKSVSSIKEFKSDTSSILLNSKFKVFKLIKLDK